MLMMLILTCEARPSVRWRVGHGNQLARAFTL